MLDVITVEQALQILTERFGRRDMVRELPLEAACGRTSGRTVCAKEYVPPYHRSMVDGYAVRAADTFGAGEAIPALLRCKGTIEMGHLPEQTLEAKACMAVPTGGAVPDGADAVVMVEDTQMFPDGTVCIYKAAAPGNHMVYRGDDVKPGDAIVRKGSLIGPREMGALAAAGIAAVPVEGCLSAGVISTGDELVVCGREAEPGTIRDVNGPMLMAALKEMGIHAVDYGIIPDDQECLEDVVEMAVKECDLVLLSGGTSVGEKDAAERVFHSLGTLLWHGLAVRPGKPTLAAEILGKPVIALPGHPMAAYFMWLLLVQPLLAGWLGRKRGPIACPCRMGERVPSNDGRETLMPAVMRGGYAWPVRGKSGLITTLLHADGYLRIPRDCEGLEAGQETRLFLFDGRGR